MGLLASAPLALTVYVLILLVRWFDDLFQPIIRQLPFIEQSIPGLGIIAGFVFIIAVGVIAPSLLGKQLLIFTEKIMERVPLAKLVYSGSKQIFDSFSVDAISKFNRVVLVEFPRPGMYAIGFVTSEYAKSLHPEIGDIKIAVFVPTTPNPTSGYLVFVPERDTKSLNLSVEEALKLIISGGLAKPAQFSA